MGLENYNWSELLTYAVRVLAAFALAFPIAWEREKNTRIMGLRTFPIVAMGTCAYMLVTLAIAPENEDSQMRAMQGLMGGIGFVGGGAILKEGPTVRGTATAASIWATGALGAAVGFGRFDIAIVISLITFLTLRILTPIEEELGKGNGDAKANKDEAKGDSDNEPAGLDDA
jgi:putative Mg2+ transporter-C (MgtC) family protein